MIGKEKNSPLKHHLLSTDCFFFFSLSRFNHLSLTCSHVMSNSAVKYQLHWANQLVGEI